MARRLGFFDVVGTWAHMHAPHDSAADLRMPAGNAATSASTWNTGADFLSLDYALSFWRTGTWTRVTLPLPPQTATSGRRYRLIVQRMGGVATEWAISNLYMGNGCPLGCGGRGRCVSDTCVCDGQAVFNGSTCLAPEGLPTEFRETFDAAVTPANWVTIQGGAVQTTVLTSGSSMGFPGSNAASQASSRRMVTVDLDLRNATFVEFFLMTQAAYYNTLTFLTSTQVQVTTSYSVDGGMTWRLLGVSGTSSNQRMMPFVFQLPAEARVNGCRLQWWQPTYAGATSATFDGWVRLGMPAEYCAALWTGRYGGCWTWFFGFPGGLPVVRAGGRLCVLRV
jgi:hypothetical protein